MNINAQRVAANVLLRHPVITLRCGSTLYHGARSYDSISHIRKNAMFTSHLTYAVDYAFKRDLPSSLPEGIDNYKPLNRSLFCCTLKRDIDVVKLQGIDWVALCSDLHHADNSIPLSDDWLQNHLPNYLKQHYGPNISGGWLLASNPSEIDEYIFIDGDALMNIHRRID